MGKASDDVPTWTVTERRYWQMEDAPALTGHPPTLIRAELERISELIVRSEVPVTRISIQSPGWSSVEVTARNPVAACT